MNNQIQRLTNNGLPFKIHHKFRDFCIVPDVAIDAAHRLYKTMPDKTNLDWHNAEFITTDGVKVHLEYRATWSGDQKEVNNKIKQMYKHDIAKHKSFYKITNDKSYWHYIKMERL